MGNDLKAGTVQINLSNESQVLPVDGKASNINIHVNVSGAESEAESMARTASAAMKILLEE